LSITIGPGAVLVDGAVLGRKLAGRGPHFGRHFVPLRQVGLVFDFVRVVDRGLTKRRQYGRIACAGFLSACDAFQAPAKRVVNELNFFHQHPEAGRFLPLGGWAGGGRFRRRHELFVGGVSGRIIFGT
jgi:hypothetical protein